MTELDKFLFHEPIGKARKTLFRNRAGLCRDLIGYRGGSVKEDLPGLKAQLSQWLKRGNEENSRPIPQETLEEIQKLIADILSEDEVDPSQVIEEFQRAYNNTKTPPTIIDTASTFVDLQKHITTAETLFITLTNFKSYISDCNGEKLVQLLKFLTQALGKRDGSLKEISIVFNRMHQFWEFTKELALQHDDTSNHPNLNFFINISYLTTVDAIFLDVGEANQKSFLLVDANVIVPITMPSDKQDTLIESIYIPLKSSSESIRWSYDNH